MATNKRRKAISVLSERFRGRLARGPGRSVSRLGTSGRDQPTVSSHGQGVCNHRRSGQRRGALSVTVVRRDLRFLLHDLLTLTRGGLQAVRVSVKS